MKKLILVAALAAPALFAQTVSGSAYCSGNWWNGEAGNPMIQISGTVKPADVGLPGAVWVGVEDPERPGFPSAFLTPTGWIPPIDGSFPTYIETPALGSSFSYSACIPYSPQNPACGTNTAAFAGWTVYVGYGVLTPEHQNLIAARRSTLDTSKPAMQQNGTWKAAYEDDIAFRNALVQKSANDGRWGPALTVPFLNCDTGSDH